MHTLPLCYLQLWGKFLNLWFCFALKNPDFAPVEVFLQSNPGESFLTLPVFFLTSFVSLCWDRFSSLLKGLLGAHVIQLAPMRARGPWPQGLNALLLWELPVLHLMVKTHCSFLLGRLPYLVLWMASSAMVMNSSIRGLCAASFQMVQFSLWLYLTSVAKLVEESEECLQYGILHGERGNN